jgi:hypothetical protein
MSPPTRLVRREGHARTQREARERIGIERLATRSWAPQRDWRVRPPDDERVDGRVTGGRARAPDVPESIGAGAWELESHIGANLPGVRRANRQYVGIGRYASAARSHYIATAGPDQIRRAMHITIEYCTV